MFKLISFCSAIVLCFFLITDGISQDVEYGKQVVKDLASEDMFGRGYVKNGHTKAAEYIATEYKKWGLSMFNESYYQEFYIKVNTFPGEVKVQVNEDWLKGNEFILSPASPSLKGSYEVKRLNCIPKSPKKNLQDKFVLIKVGSLSKKKEKRNEQMKRIYTNQFGAKGIVLTNDKKLTFSYAQKQNDFVLVEVIDSVLDNKVNAIKLDIGAEFKEKQKTQNVIGYIPGTEYPDSFVVFTGHYDHLGGLGQEIYFPGANDNASGIAMILSLAKYYSANPSKYTVVFLAFSAEEAGLLGSEYFVENPTFDIMSIKFLVNMDIFGTGDEGIQIVNSTVFTEESAMLDSINSEKGYVKQIKRRGKAKNSDHYYFTEKGIRAFFIYTLGGISAYHDVYDRPETLPLTKFDDLRSLLIDFVTELEK